MYNVICNGDTTCEAQLDSDIDTTMGYYMEYLDAYGSDSYGDYFTQSNTTTTYGMETMRMRRKNLSKLVKKTQSLNKKNSN